MKKVIYIAIISILIHIISCGNPPISVTEDDFEPKIVIEGYIFPEQEVNILVTKNFPLNSKSPVNKFELLIEDANVNIIDVSMKKSFQLIYNPATLYYENKDDSLVIEYGKTYRLEVEANYNSKEISAFSETTIPAKGFEIVESQSFQSSLHYREHDQSGDLKQFKIDFKRSPGIGFYAFLISAMDASDLTYIYDNPYVENDSSEVNFYLDDMKTYFDWMQNLPLDPIQEPTISTKQMEWRGFLFYGKYQVIVYAADQNFEDFFLTHSTVQEIDGNFHEPAFHIGGDGIGIFGSAIADTVFFEVLPD